MPRRSNEQIINDLIEEGATLLHEAHELNQGLTDTYRKLAGVIVDLRKRFPNSKGTGPDWRGTTQEYRDAAGRMYEAAGVPADSLSGMQAAIRYHIGNVLRERLTEKELLDAGLQAEGPLERSRRSREAASAGIPENEEEWFNDTVTTLKSIEESHPDVVIVDLRDEGNDTIDMLNRALTVLQTAHERGVPDDVKAAASSVLDQIVAEAAAFRAEVAPTRARAAAR